MSRLIIRWLNRRLICMNCRLKWYWFHSNIINQSVSRNLYKPITICFSLIQNLGRQYVVFKCYSMLYLYEWNQIFHFLFGNAIVLSLFLPILLKWKDNNIAVQKLADLVPSQRFHHFLNAIAFSMNLNFVH